MYQTNDIFLLDINFRQSTLNVIILNTYDLS